MTTLLTPAETARRLGTTPRFVRRLVAERRIAFHRVGRYIRIAEPDLEAFLAASRVSPGGELVGAWHRG